MSAATKAKSAQARATIAIRLLKTTQPWPRGYDLGRNFDDCFEMGDGNEVHALVVTKARFDPELRAAMRKHSSHVGTWLEEAYRQGVKE